MYRGRKTSQDIDGGGGVVEFLVGSVRRQEMLSSSKS